MQRQENWARWREQSSFPKKIVPWIKCSVSPNPSWGWRETVEAWQILWCQRTWDFCPDCHRSLTAIYDFTWVAENTENLLRAKPGSRDSLATQCLRSGAGLLVLLQGSWGSPRHTDHLASSGKGLQKSPSGKLPELSQLLRGWHPLSCKHTSTHEDATHSQERLCPWDPRS